MQLDPNQLDLLSVPSANGQLTPLNFGLLAAVTISFNLKSGMSLGSVTDKIEELARQT